MRLRFKLDENIPREAEVLLSGSGHDSHSVISEDIAGCPDEELIEVCRREQRILVTLDLDFSDIRLYPPALHSGIWILRPPSQSVSAICSLLERALSMLKVEPAERHLWIVDIERVRIRD